MSVPTVPDLDIKYEGNSDSSYGPRYCSSLNALTRTVPVTVMLDFLMTTLTSCCWFLSRCLNLWVDWWIAERALRYEGLLARFNGHKSGGEFVSYTGNGHIGLRSVTFRYRRFGYFRTRRVTSDFNQISQQGVLCFIEDSYWFVKNGVVKAKNHILNTYFINQ